MYYIWHTYFINQEHENISMSRYMGDLWPLFQGPMNSHFQTTSALKSQGQLWPYFIFNLLGLGEQKFIQMVAVCWPRWPICPYMVKTLQKIFFRTKKQETLKLCIKHRWLEAFQMCSNDDPKLTFAFPAKRLDWLSYAFIWEKYWKVNFSRTVEGWCIIFGTDTSINN